MNIRYLASQSRKLLHTYFLHIHMHHKHKSVARCDQLSDFPNDALKSHPLHCSTCFLSSRSSQASGSFSTRRNCLVARSNLIWIQCEYFEIALFVEFWRKYYDGFRLGSIIISNWGCNTHRSLRWPSSHPVVLRCSSNVFKYLLQDFQFPAIPLGNCLKQPHPK